MNLAPFREEGRGKGFRGVLARPVIFSRDLTSRVSHTPRDATRTRGHVTRSRRTRLRRCGPLGCVLGLLSGSAGGLLPRVAAAWPGQLGAAGEGPQGEVARQGGSPGGGGPGVHFSAQVPSLHGTGLSFFSRSAGWGDTVPLAQKWRSWPRGGFLGQSVRCRLTGAGPPWAALAPAVPSGPQGTGPLPSGSPQPGPLWPGARSGGLPTLSRRCHLLPSLPLCPTPGQFTPPDSLSGFPLPKIIFFSSKMISFLYEDAP